MVMGAARSRTMNWTRSATPCHALRRLQAQEGAGGADAQLAVNRHQSNIRALEAELQRLPASVRRQP